ncbi:MAG TPA: response regulator [Epsilonproteobacteria bacterium]|nr:response regulator [Campylobacterota bacterium]
MKKTWIGLSIVVCAEATESFSVQNIETFWIWIALFALAMIGITILFVSSRQTMKIQKLHQDMLQKQLEMEKNQNLLLTNMSENIHHIAKQALERSNQAIEQTQQHYQTKEEVLENVENRLLTVTNDLIDFLRLKSKKVEIVNEKFNINNVLNEISGSICSRFSGKNTELIFDIDNNVPRYMVGDSLHLGQILSSILDHIMEHFSGDEVKLEISMFNTFDENIELQFKFSDTGGGISTEKLEALFTPYYDENKGAYIGLGLFVANELVSMMNGELSVESILGKGNIFTLTLPFSKTDDADKRVYRLPEKIFSAKKVFIVDNNYNSALAIKKMFAYFKHEVKVISKDEFLRNMPNLTPYDIVVLNEGLFTIRLVEYLNKIKTGKELRVIALNDLIHAHKNNFVDAIIDVHLFKPLNQERILEMIIDMYDIKVPTAFNTEKKGNLPQANIHKGHIVGTKNVTPLHFQEFKGKNILIVEDNLINQKVLINLLHQSEIHISVANNGQEAVDLVKGSKNDFDLVLMDINMPIMDGYTATQMIRLDAKYDNLPIVAFTALVLESEIRKMFNSGINAFLAKPLNIGKLYTVFAMYLSEKPISETLEENGEEVYENYDGLDVQKGISHANNSVALYIEVIKEFGIAYGKSAEVFEKLVLEHRYEQIRMLCVDLRGLTGTIGAYDMHGLITEIHQCLLYNKRELLPNYIAKYTFEMKTLNKSIQKVVAL